MENHPIKSNTLNNNGNNQKLNNTAASHSKTSTTTRPTNLNVVRFFLH
jgi:hypothetical protein